MAAQAETSLTAQAIHGGLQPTQRKPIFPRPMDGLAHVTDDAVGLAACSLSIDLDALAEWVTEEFNTEGDKPL